MTLWPRSILHADLDAFFASVEQLDNPALRGKPVLVGGTGGRGVVAAASYEARQFGCHSAMPMAMAMRLCPSAVVVAPNFDRYLEISQRFRKILLDQTPLIEPLSIDEAFLDVTGSQQLLGSGERIAQTIRQRTFSELGITVSVGVATCKFIAKIASDMRKPDGLTVITEAQQIEILSKLPIERMWGVGAKTAPKLHRYGLHTFADLQRRSEGEVASVLGDVGVQWRKLALGEDTRPVIAEREAFSVGHEQTFREDVSDLATLREVLRQQCEGVAIRLRAGGGVAQAVTLQFRLSDFQTFSRSLTLAQPTDATLQIWRQAEKMLQAWHREQPSALRLIGIRVDRIDAVAQQPDLFEDRGAARQRTLDSVADAVTSKYGADALRRAGSQAHGPRKKRN